MEIVDDSSTEKDNRLATRHCFSFLFSFPSFFFSITNGSRHVRTRVAFVTNFFRASAKRETARRIRGEFVFSSERFRLGKRDDAGRRMGSLRSSSRRRTNDSSPVRSVSLLTPRSFCERVASGPLHTPSRISPCFENRLARTDIDWNR